MGNIKPTRVSIEVISVKGQCAANYKPGDKMFIEEFYIPPNQKCKICIHALNSFLTIILPYLKGVPAERIGFKDAIYLQCPDPGPPYSKGGTVLFRIIIEK